MFSHLNNAFETEITLQRIREDTVQQFLTPKSPSDLCPEENTNILHFCLLVAKVRKKRRNNVIIERVLEEKGTPAPGCIESEAYVKLLCLCSYLMSRQEARINDEEMSSAFKSYFTTI